MDLKLTIFCLILIQLTLATYNLFYDKVHIEDSDVIVVSAKRMRPNQAALFCSNQKLEIVAIRNSNIQEKITYYMKLYNIPSIWTSGSDFNLRGNFSWNNDTNGWNKFNYTNWIKGYPVKSFGTTFVKVNAASNYKWANVNEWGESNVICIGSIVDYLKMQYSYLFNSNNTSLNWNGNSSNVTHFGNGTVRENFNSSIITSGKNVMYITNSQINVY